MSLIALLIHLLVLVLVMGVAYMIIDAIWPGDARFKRIGMAIVGLIFLLYVLNMLGLWGGNGRVFR
jgi:hypothetical protein